MISTQSVYTYCLQYRSQVTWQTSASDTWVNFRNTHVHYEYLRVQMGTQNSQVCTHTQTCKRSNDATQHRQPGHGPHVHLNASNNVHALDRTYMRTRLWARVWARMWAMSVRTSRALSAPACNVYILVSRYLACICQVTCMYVFTCATCIRYNVHVHVGHDMSTWFDM